MNDLMQQTTSSLVTSDDPKLKPCPCGNGRIFIECHGKAFAPTISIAPPVVTRKLDLACGQSKKEGFEGVDWIAAPGVDHVVDLTKYPWPFEDNSVEEIHSSHYIEHIPGEYITMPDGSKKDALLAFFDECYRILIPDGWLNIQWPCLQSVRAFQDPTHRRFIPAEMTLYLHANWRKLNKLDHYNVSCDFECSVSWSHPDHLNTRADEVKMRIFAQEWNQMIDFFAKCKVHKPARTS